MPRGISRRRLLAGAGVLGALGGCSPVPGAHRPTDTDTDAVLAHGSNQAGIARPKIAQQHCDVSIWDMRTADVATTLARMGRTITTLADGSNPALAGLTPAALTVTVGVGPRLVQAVDPGLPGAADLPDFPGDQVDDRYRGGDLLLQVCAENPVAGSLAVTELVRVAGADVRPRWRQGAFRGPVRADGASRNLLGFTDGIVVPRDDAELAADVWLAGPGEVAGGTIAVVRRMRLDVPAFLALPQAEQERVFGRCRDTAEPLSGGGPDGVVDLAAKSPDGQYLVPVDAHVRRAHPRTSGAGLMLRRSYTFDDGPIDRGLLFISFQNLLRTFTATQHRLAEGDALLRFATTTASATFLVLPGFDDTHPLGATLFR